MHSITRRLRTFGQSFQTKLMLALLLPLMVIWISVLVTSESMLKGQQIFVGEQQESAARLQADQLNEKIKDRWAILEATAANLDLQLLSAPDYASNFLAQRFSLNSIFNAGTVVFDRAGMALGDYPVEDGRKGGNYADRGYLQRLFATGKPTISQPFAGRPSGKMQISLCVPIAAAGQQVRGALCGNIDMSAGNFLGNLSDPKTMGNNGFFLIRTSDRVLIASTDSRRVMSQLPDNPLVHQLTAAEGNAFVGRNVGGVEKLYASAPVAVAEWALALGLPTDIAYAPIRAAVDRLKLEAALVSLLVMLLAFFITRRMLQPLKQAGQKMDAMSSGREPLQRLNEVGDAEVCSLLISFNRLGDSVSRQQELLQSERDALQSAKEALSQLNQELESKVAERTLALSNANQQLSLATDSAQIGIWDYDLAEDKISWSQWMYALYGVRQEDFGGAYAAWRAGLHPDDVARGDAEIAQALRGEKEFDTEFRVIWPSGEVRHIKAAALVQRDASGTAVRMIGVNYDITQLKNSEEAIAKAMRLAESANLAKTDFLANMSHEIRSPLNAILGLAYLLEQSRLGAEAQSMVRKIRASGRMLLSLISDILDMSKIEAGQMMIEQAPYRLADVMDNAAVALGVAVGEKDIEIVISPLPAGLNSILGDALRVEQVLINLISNAVKFTQVGSIQVRTEVLGDVNSTPMLRFSVKDTGIGIAPELHGSVFTAFAQADTSTTRRFGGTGLGLTICRQLVGLMGGEIGVISTPGVGSEFWFTVPLLPADEPNYSSPGMVAVSVLIADDSAIALKAIADTATSLGWQVSTVDSGAAALAQVLERKQGRLPDVVLLDWKMPGLDGLAAAGLMRDGLAQHECPIVIMATAYSTTDLAAQPGAELVDAILHKPVTSSGLYNAVMEAQSSRAAAAGLLPAVAQTSSNGLAGLRLLVVDDSDINREVAQRILAGQGATVALADDGQQAIDWLVAHTGEVDLVLMDVQMPVLDGLEATRRLRRMPQFDGLPIVALTAGAFKSQHETALAAGMTHFVSKPFDVPSTVALIQRLCKPIAMDEIAQTTTTLPAANAGMASAPTGHSAMDIAQGLALWSDAPTYQTYLRRFVSDYSAATLVMQASLARGERASAAAFAHKLSGVAANLALTNTRQAAQELERVLGTQEDPAQALALLGDAMAGALAEIHRFAPPASGAQGATATAAMDAPISLALTAEQQQALKPHLIKLLAALDTDNATPVKACLATLAQHLQPEALSAIWVSVLGYDFRGAEGHTQQLATQLEIDLWE